MSDLVTMPATDLDVEPDEVTETGEPIAAHIVKTKRGENAAAVVLEARVMGTPIEALCGFVWVPSRIPSSCRCARSARASTRCTRRSTTACATRPKTDRPIDTSRLTMTELRIRQAVRALLVTDADQYHARALRVPEGHGVVDTRRRVGAGRRPPHGTAPRTHRRGRSVRSDGRPPRVDPRALIPFEDGMWDGQRDVVHSCRPSDSSRNRCSAGTSCAPRTLTRSAGGRSTRSRPSAPIRPRRSCSRHGGSANCCARSSRRHPGSPIYSGI